MFHIGTGTWIIELYNPCTGTYVTHFLEHESKTEILHNQQAKDGLVCVCAYVHLSTAST